MPLQRKSKSAAKLDLEENDEGETFCCLTKRFNDALAKEKLVDVTFVVGPDSVQRKAHKMVLSLTSEVFEVMFYGSFSGNVKIIEIPDVEIEAFDIMIKYAYTNTVTLESTKDAISVAYAAKKYLLSDLMRKVVSYLSVNNNTENVCEIYRAAILLDLEQLKESCILFVSKNYAQVLETEGFNSLPDDIVRSVTALMGSSVDSTLLFRSLVRWGCAQYRFDQTVSSKMHANQTKALRDKLMPLLPYVRFLTMTTKQFLQSVGNANVLEDSEILSIVVNIENYGDRPLPGWCNTAREDRKAKKASVKKGSIGSRSGVRSLRNNKPIAYNALT